MVECARRLFQAQGSNIDRMLPVYDNAGIETRYSCVPLDWYREPTGWKERNAIFVDNAVELLRRAAQDWIVSRRVV